MASHRPARCLPISFRKSLRENSGEGPAGQAVWKNTCKLFCQAFRIQTHPREYFSPGPLLLTPFLRKPRVCIRKWLKHEVSACPMVIICSCFVFVLVLQDTSKLSVASSSSTPSAGYSSVPVGGKRPGRAKYRLVCGALDRWGLAGVLREIIPHSLPVYCKIYSR
jgi:hypothetical protein